MRRHGRFLLEEYFQSLPRIVFTALEVLRNRIGIPPTPYKAIRHEWFPIEKYFAPAVPAELNFLDEETKEEFITLQVTDCN